MFGCWVERELHEAEVKEKDPKRAAQKRQQALDSCLTNKRPDDIFEKELKPKPVQGRFRDPAELVGR